MSLTGSVLCQAVKAAASQGQSDSSRLLSSLPLTFEENDGQLSPEISFAGQAHLYSVGIRRDGLLFAAPGDGGESLVNVRFAGSRGGSPVSLSGVSFRSNYLLGNDPSQWQQGVPNFSRVGIREIYPGIDAEFYEKNGQFEHDFVVAPERDAGNIRLDLKSVQRAKLTGEGDVVIPIKTGELRFRKPAAYQFDGEGKRVEVAASYLLKGHSLRFRLGAYDRSRTLVIDPVIAFATYIRGSSGSTPYQLTTDGGTHIYLTGTTSSSLSSFPSTKFTNKNGLSDPATGVTDVFVAGLTATNLGAGIDWITFLGGSKASSSTSIAYSSYAAASPSPKTGTLYIGGQTFASNFSGGTASKFPKATGSATGFVASLNITGQQQSPSPASSVRSTFVTTVNPASTTVKDATIVTGVAADVNGNVYVSGYGLGGELTPLKGFDIPVTDQATDHNAFVEELNSSLTPQFATYVQGATAGDYKATAIQLDGNTGIIYIGGQTSDTFSMAQASGSTFSASTDYGGCTAKTSPGSSAFLAQIEPPGVAGNATTAARFGFTAIACGSDGSDTANGLALSHDGSKLYLAGSTTSSDLISNIFYTVTSSTAKSTASGLTGLMTMLPGASQYGYVLQVLPLAVAPAPSAFTYIGDKTGNTAFYAAAVDDNEGLLQVAGNSNVASTSMPGASTATPLPSGQDPTAGGGTQRGLLYTLTDNLATADSISYFGGLVTQSMVTGVQSDGAGNAYVLVNDHAPSAIADATTPVSFTSSSAVQLTPGASTAAEDFAYVAEVQGTAVPATPAPGLTLAVASGSPDVCQNENAVDVCEIGFNSDTDYSTITYSWVLSTTSATPANNVVLNFPQQVALSSTTPPTGTAPGYTITTDIPATTTDPTPITCVSQQISNGTTCTLAAPFSGSHTITLMANASPQDPSYVGTAQGTIKFDATAADAQGEYKDAPQPDVTVANPPSITLTYTLNGSMTPAPVNAGKDASGTDGTPVTYTVTVKNTSANDSPNTTLSVTQLPTPTKFLVSTNGITAMVGATNVASKCDTTGGTGCASAVDVPAGASLVYTIKGVFLGAGFGGTTAGPFSFPMTATATALPLSTKNKQQSQSLTTMVNGYANMTVGVTAPTYPGTGYTNAATAFNLGAGPLTYKIMIANNGPNAVSTSDSSGNKLSFANTLPAGFVVSQTSTTTALANGAVATCAPAGTGCSITALPSAGTITYTIIGSFPDNGAAPDAVPQNAQNAIVTDAATFAALPAGTYNPNAPSNVPPSNSQPVTVQRLVHLKLSVQVTSAPTAAGTGYTPSGFNLNSTLNKTPVTYTYTLENDGPDIAVGIVLASSDAPATTITPAYTAPPGSFSVAVPTGASMNCPGTTNAFASCKVTSILPGTAPAFAFNVSYPDLTPAAGVFSGRAVSAVPGDAPSAPWTYLISTPWSPTPLAGQPFPGYPSAVDNNVTASTAGDYKNNTSATIYRTSHLKLTLATSQAKATGASYPLQPGYNLGSTVNYTYTLENDGPNAAIYVPLNNVFAYSGTPPAGYAPGTGISVAATNTNDLSCMPPPATGLYTSSCTVRAVSPATPSSFVFPVTFPDTPLPLATSIAAESLSAVPTDKSSATYNYTATAPAAAYNNSIDGNPSATSGGSNTSTVPATIYRTVHLKVVLSAGAVSFNLQDTVPYTYKLTNTGPDVALNVAFNGTLAAVNPPAGFAVQPSYFAVPTAPGGNFTCSFGAGYTSSVCTAGAVPVSGTSPSVGIASTENLPAAYSATQADFSAVPSNITSQGYQYSATAVNPYTNAIDAAPAAADNTSAANITLNRTSAITASPSVSGLSTAPPCLKAGSSSPCFYMVNPNHIDDTGTYTVNITNTGPNAATNATLTFALPANFAVADKNNPIPASTFNYSFSGSNGNLLQCTFQSATAPATATCTGLVPKGTLQAVVASQFNGSTVPLTASAATTGNLPGTQNSVSTNAAALKAVVTQAPLPVVTIYRAAHLITVKSVTPAPGNKSPNGFSLPVSTGGPSVVAVNLDEKVPGDAPGKNDLVQVVVQVGNSGLNDAVSVMVKDTLPAYFILTKMPDPSIARDCTLTGATTADSAGNSTTGSSSSPVVLQCTFINPVPHGTGNAGTGGANGTHGTVTANALQLIYYGKFQDNGRNTGIIPLTQNSILASTSTAAAMSNDIQDLDAQLMATMADLTSPTPVPVPVQRAAHLHFTLTQYVQTNDTALPPVGGIPGTGLPAPGIAEAQLGANGGEAINSIRYQVKVTNDGPNIATDPIVSTTLPPNPGNTATKFVNLAQSIEPSLTTGFPTVPANCGAGQACQDAGMLATGSSVSYNVDGNFDVNTLVEGNAAPRTFTSSISDLTVVDSNPSATTGGDQQTSLPVSVVNTPVGSNFTVAPFAANLSQPMHLTLKTVPVAGITSLGVVPQASAQAMVAAASGATPPLPSGPSPNPPDNAATVPLYRYGQNGTYYALGTTAGVPSANANQTTLCLTSIPDSFQKPERVLLWALTNAPANTAFNSVPNYAASSTAGDITSLVVPQGGSFYQPIQTSSAYPPQQTTQPQPAEVCGVVNGLADATAPTTLAILEPVNFAPYVRASLKGVNNSSPFSKGVTAAAEEIDLTIDPKTGDYDYNDNDPCYTGANGARSSCNDNLQMTSFVFGGGNLIGETQQVQTYFYGDLASNPTPQFNLPAGQPQLYVVLADQLGAEGYLQMSSVNGPQVCDPGTTSSFYTPSAPACPNPVTLPTTASTPPPQTILQLPSDTSVKVAFITNSVGFGGSSGLIPLPQAASPEAIAGITQGQTAGFAWNWLTEQPQVQSASSLTLTCASADGTNFASMGIQCNVPSSYSYATGGVVNAPPAIYIVTSGNTTVGALSPLPGSRTAQIVAAVVFPLGAIPLVVLLGRRKALKASGWLAILLFAGLVGAAIGCGSSSAFSTPSSAATPAGTYQFVVTASGTDGSGKAVSIKTYPFAVKVTAVH